MSLLGHPQVPVPRNVYLICRIPKVVEGEEKKEPSSREQVTVSRDEGDTQQDTGSRGMADQTRVPMVQDSRQALRQSS